MAWTFLLLAALLEMVWAIGLRFTEGFTRLGPTVATLTAMVVSMALLAQAVRTIPVGTGYAVWTGLGAAGTAVLGMLLLGESRSPARIACLAAIVAGAIGLKLSE